MQCVSKVREQSERRVRGVSRRCTQNLHCVDQKQKKREPNPAETPEKLPLSLTSERASENDRGGRSRRTRRQSGRALKMKADSEESAFSFGRSDTKSRRQRDFASFSLGFARRGLRGTAEDGTAVLLLFLFAVGVGRNHDSVTLRELAPFDAGVDFL
jgi:hypothetical protein